MDVTLNLCIFLDIFLHLHLKTTQYFRRWLFLSSGEQPNELGPLKKLISITRPLQVIYIVTINIQRLKHSLYSGFIMMNTCPDNHIFRTQFHWSYLEKGIGDVTQATIQMCQTL
jgi:hypothetical protein